MLSNITIIILKSNITDAVAAVDTKQLTIGLKPPVGQRRGGMKESPRNSSKAWNIYLWMTVISSTGIYSTE